MSSSGDYENILKSLKQGIIIIDQSGEIIFINEAAKRFLDLGALTSPEEICNIPVHYDDTTDSLGQYLMRLVEMEKPTYGSAEIKMNSNAYMYQFNVYPTEDTGKSALVLISPTAKKIAPYSVYREDEALKIKAYKAFDHLSETLVLINKVGKVVYINHGIESILGIPRYYFLGRSYLMLLQYSQTYESEGLSLLRETLKGKAYGYQEINLIDQKGRQKVLLGTTAPLFSSSSQIEGAVGVFQDITQERIESEQFQRWQQRFRMTEKLAVVGEMAAGTAHELKNPLGAIKGYLQFLQKTSVSEAQKQDYLQVVMNEVSRIEGVLHEFLQLSKPAQSDLGVEAVYMCEVFPKSLNLVYPQLLKNNIDFSFACKGYPVWITGDHNKLKQVIINIVKNAIEAMEQNESGMPRKLDILLSPDFQTKTLTLYFRDTGPGIPEHLIHKLFSPFATTKPSGTGLGLPVSMQIVKNMGGYLGAENTKEGACFYLELPIANYEPRGFCLKPTKLCCRRILLHEN